MQVVRCPHCGDKTRIRKSEAVTATARQGMIECKNADCGWRGQFTWCVTHTLSPSLAPNASVSLPLAPRLEKQLAGAGG